MLEDALLKIIPRSRVKTRLIDRYAYASDASHFYLVPKAVVQPITVEEIQKLFAVSQELNLPITFRAGGTSLSGQAVSDGILADLSNYWRKVTPENNGETVRVEPGAIGAHVNIHLKKFGKKIGPDPASINAAMIGGILSNNSSGMCCGVVNNSYHTLKHLTFVLPNGQVFSTERKEDYDRFLKDCKEIASSLLALKQEVEQNEALVARIRKKYKQKNTVGYCMNAFLDYDHPLDILTHVIIGGEGTLAFIAEAVLNTIPDFPFKMTGMLYFDSPAEACNTIAALRDTGAEALEFMDRASLRSVEDMPGVPDFIKTLPEQASAILCEYQESTQERLDAKYEIAKPTLAKLPMLFEPIFTQNPTEQALYWKIRKGMYPSVAGMRAKGTSALMEDFTFPVERLGEAVVDVQQLFVKHKYENGIIFGHAKDGNLHFVVSQSYATPEAIALYEEFNDDLFDLVLNKYDGALKGEHSSGRAVSAYVETEWGPEAYSVMKRLKQLIDPHNLLNPGIVITEDKKCHVHNLKVMPIVEEEVDKCIECGFCENSCPSRDYTLTPRRRIGIRRAIKQAEMAGDHATKDALLKDYAFDGIETCAVDGMCATNCPVDINTGDLVKRLRRENHSSFENKVAVGVARNFKWIESGTRLALWKGFLLNKLFGQQFMPKLTAGMKRITPGMPLWSNHFQKSAIRELFKAGRSAPGEGQSVVYFSSCISRMMDGDGVRAFLSVCKKANINIVLPDQLKGTCCGQVFSSKGFAEAYKFTANQAIERLWQSSQEGKIPVVLDVTSCTQTIKSSRPYLTDANKVRFDKLIIHDVIDFAAEIVLPQLHISAQKDKIAFHPVCSVQKMGSLDQLKRIGKACAKEVKVPEFAGCCGMAGDRGFYYPELTKAATKKESTEVKQETYDGYYSTSKTCEIALSEAVGKNYESVMKLLDEVSSAKGG
tara:strand:- start:124341 stop:127160 length:2820 start_codon:yes stop_codon:yes gene_type:complete